MNPPSCAQGSAQALYNEGSMKLSNPSATLVSTANSLAPVSNHLGVAMNLKVDGYFGKNVRWDRELRLLRA